MILNFLDIEDLRYVTQSRVTVVVNIELGWEKYIPILRNPGENMGTVLGIGICSSQSKITACNERTIFFIFNMELQI